MFFFRFLLFFLRLTNQKIGYESLNGESSNSIDSEIFEETDEKKSLFWIYIDYKFYNFLTL